MKNSFTNSESVIDTDKEVSNNLGEILKTVKLQSKDGKKLQALKESVSQGKDILKTLDMSDDVDVAKAKVKSLLVLLYKGHHLIKQMGYLDRKKNTADVVTQAYYIMASKSESYDKQSAKLTAELDELN